MIKLSKVDGTQFIINADEIETIETAHDSTISMKSGRKIIVKETADEIINLVILYKQNCFSKLPEMKNE